MAYDRLLNPLPKQQQDSSILSRFDAGRHLDILPIIPSCSNAYHNSHSLTIQLNELIWYYLRTISTIVDTYSHITTYYSDINLFVVFKPLE